ncbi:unnamed protein product [[Actinomadura] parvosata subsp. kistnae]|nr:unnamed protein product [Actinomadura parvosata subsp. kistnae]
MLARAISDGRAGMTSPVRRIAGIECGLFVAEEAADEGTVHKVIRRARTA